MNILKKLRKSLIIAGVMTVATTAVTAMPAMPLQAAAPVEATEGDFLVAPTLLFDDVEIPVYGTFGFMETVQAFEWINNEMVDLTSRVTLSGVVNTAVPGKYELLYSVTSDEGLTTEAVRTITVYEKHVGDTYDADMIYGAGDSVIYAGEEYIAQWWTRADLPDQSLAWKAVNPVHIEEHVEGKAYYAGDKAMYNGDMYVAQYRTRALPGTDASWRIAF